MKARALCALAVVVLGGGLTACGAVEAIQVIDERATVESATLSAELGGHAADEVTAFGEYWQSVQAGPNYCSQDLGLSLTALTDDGSELTLQLYGYRSDLPAGPSGECEETSLPLVLEQASYDPNTDEGPEGRFFLWTEVVVRGENEALRPQVQAATTFEVDDGDASEGERRVRIRLDYPEAGFIEATATVVATTTEDVLYGVGWGAVLVDQDPGGDP